MRESATSTRVAYPKNVLLLLSITLLLYGCEKLLDDKEIKVSTDEVTSVGYTSVTAKGTVVQIDKRGIIEYGFCYSTAENPTIQDAASRLGSTSATGAFTDSITGLADNTTYYIRAYAQNSLDDYYGEQLSFTTHEYGVPSVTTNTATGITDSSAITGGNVLSDGGKQVTERGIWFGTLANPETTGTKVQIGSNTGAFSRALVDLEPSTVYYTKAYAVNSAGTGFGAEVSFTTLSSISNPPTVEVSAATGVTNTTVTLNGAVNANGSNTAVTFEYGTTSLYGSVAAADQSPVNGTTTTNITATLTGLAPGTLYHFRARAVSEDGTTYSDDLTFTTLQMPEATTGEASSVTFSSATLNATVNAANLSTTVVFEYGTTTSYGSTIAGNPSPVTGGNVTGVIAQLTALDCNTTYYFRVAATNSSGTVYGDQLTFNTLSCPVKASVTTTSISNLTPTSVQAGGFVTDEGGALVTEKGVCWSTSPNPTVPDDNYLSEGSGLGAFSISVTNLQRYSTYYLRAYAINSEGIGYGEEISFKTLWDNSTFSDLDGNDYKTVQIGDQIWMAENLKVTRFPTSGNPIALVTSSATWDAFTYTGEDKAYCYYDNSGANLSTYGALYTWAAVMNGKTSSNSNPSGVQGVCPSGWHLPSDQEWKVLETTLGMDPGVLDDTGFRGTDEGGKLKDTESTLWTSPNTGATNESGFTALPGGQRTKTGAFSGDNTSANFWSSTEISSQTVYNRSLNWSTSTVSRGSGDKLYGLSVRCVRD